MASKKRKYRRGKKDYKQDKVYFWKSGYRQTVEGGEQRGWENQRAKLDAWTSNSSVNSSATSTQSTDDCFFRQFQETTARGTLHAEKLQEKRRMDIPRLTCSQTQSSTYPPGQSLIQKCVKVLALYLRHTARILKLILASISSSGHLDCLNFSVDQRIWPRTLATRTVRNTVAAPRQLTPV